MLRISPVLSIPRGVSSELSQRVLSFVQHMGLMLQMPAIFILVPNVPLC